MSADTCSDIGMVSNYRAVAADAEADELDAGTHPLSERWPTYKALAVKLLELMAAPDTSEEERAAHSARVAADVRADEERTRARLGRPS